MDKVPKKKIVSVNFSCTSCCIGVNTVCIYISSLIFLFVLWPIFILYNFDGVSLLLVLNVCSVVPHTCCYFAAYYIVFFIQFTTSQTVIVLYCSITLL
jgi:hypothetical protein